MAKVHVSLNVSDVARSVEFYRRLFGVAPVKHKVDYAKFDVAEPPLNFTMNQHPVGAPGSLSHLGIQVASTEAVLEARARLQASGLLTEDEMATTCCYAVQDKIWLSDPDGHRWEIFHVLEGDVGAPNVEGSCCVPTEPTEDGACCAPEAKAEAIAQAKGCCA